MEKSAPGLTLNSPCARERMKIRLLIISMVSSDFRGAVIQTGFVPYNLKPMINNPLNQNEKDSLQSDNLPDSQLSDKDDRSLPKKRRVKFTKIARSQSLLWGVAFMGAYLLLALAIVLKSESRFCVPTPFGPTCYDGQGKLVTAPKPVE